MTLETLTLEAARLAEHSNVQYCNFTLRPMSYETSKVEAGKLKVSSVKLYNNPLMIDKVYFMEVNSFCDYNISVCAFCPSSFR